VHDAEQVRPENPVQVVVGHLEERNEHAAAGAVHE
jgi:hypothetical protein